MKVLFVYYKVPLQEHMKCLGLVTDFTRLLKREWPTLDVEILQRPESSVEGLETWMEVYRLPGGMNNDLIAAIARKAADMGLPPKRAAELFEPLHC
jgi:hypothetical protein